MYSYCIKAIKKGNKYTGRIKANTPRIWRTHNQCARATPVAKASYVCDTARVKNTILALLLPSVLIRQTHSQ